MKVAQQIHIRRYDLMHVPGKREHLCLQNMSRINTWGKNLTGKGLHPRVFSAVLRIIEFLKGRKIQMSSNEKLVK